VLRRRRRDAELEALRAKLATAEADVRRLLEQRESVEAVRAVRASLCHIDPFC
jgi:hypothetical protein